MGKKTLVILFIASLMFVYVLSRAQGAGSSGSAQPTGGGTTTTGTTTGTTTTGTTTTGTTTSNTATDSTQITGMQVGGAGGVQVRILDTTVEQPTPAQTAQIQAGTFISLGTQCPPAGIVCTAPNSSDSSSTCPKICYVKATVVGTPPSTQPFKYPECPAGYAAITVGSMDLLYQFTGAKTHYAKSIADRDFYLTLGYNCAVDASRLWTNCSHDKPNSGDYSVMNTGNGLGTVLYTLTNQPSCYISSSCSCCGVGCSVSAYANAEWYPIKCIRPAGYYPVALTTNLPGGAAITQYQMAPQSLICGHVNSSWVNG